MSDISRNSTRSSQAPLIRTLYDDPNDTDPTKPRREGRFVEGSNGGWRHVELKPSGSTTGSKTSSKTRRTHTSKNKKHYSSSDLPVIQESVVSTSTTFKPDDKTAAWIHDIPESSNRYSGGSDLDKPKTTSSPRPPPPPSTTLSRSTSTDTSGKRHHKKSSSSSTASSTLTSSTLPLRPANPPKQYQIVEYVEHRPHPSLGLGSDIGSNSSQSTIRAPARPPSSLLSTSTTTSGGSSQVPSGFLSETLIRDGNKVDKYKYSAPPPPPPSGSLSRPNTGSVQRHGHSGGHSGSGHSGRRKHIRITETKTYEEWRE